MRGAAVVLLCLAVLALGADALRPTRHGPTVAVILSAAAVIAALMMRRIGHV